MEKFNCLAELYKHEMTPLQRELVITLTVPMDDNLYNFLYEQARATLFMMEGKTNPKTDEIATVMASAIKALSITPAGVIAYQHYLDGGTDALLADLCKAVIDFTSNDKNVG